jgi:presenilin-like A22 family membrane protease
MRLLAAMLSFFILAQILGIYTGLIIINDFTRNPYVNSLVVTQDAEDPLNAAYFILYVLFGAVVMMVLIRYFNLMPVIFRIMEFWLIASASSIVFYAFLRLALDYEVSTIAAIALGLAFSGIKLFRPELKNSAAILATAGVGVIFGISLGLIPVILFLILLSIYDFISVFATRHMVEMAEFIIKKDLAFTVTATAPPPKPGEKMQRMDLGTGDLIAPVMLEVSAMAYNPLATVFVFAGAIVALALFMVAVYKKKMVLPALPPIVLGMVLSLMMGFLLNFY